MTQAYQQGFIQKCAEMGVDPQLLTKQAGFWSEQIGAVANPVNWFGGNLLGLAAGGLTPTRTTESQAGSDLDTWRNILIPGMAGYNTAKRLGYSIRHPEKEKVKAQLKLEMAKRELSKKGFIRNRWPESVE